MQAVRKPSFTTPPPAARTRRRRRPSGRLAAEASTASVISAARRPSANVGGPPAAAPPSDRLVDVGDERVEAVGVALRMAGGQRREARGRGRQRGRIAPDDRQRLAAPAPELLGLLLVEGDRLLVPSSSIQSRFLRPAEIWLMTTEPSAPPSVSNWTSAASSVVTARRARPPSPPGERVPARLAVRSGTAVSRRAESRVMRGRRRTRRGRTSASRCRRTRARRRRARRPRASCRRRGGAASPGGRCRGAGAARRSRPPRTRSRASRTVG